MAQPDEKEARLQRWVGRLQSLPSIALPTDYPRPTTSQVVQALSSLHLSSRTRTALVQLGIHHDVEHGHGDEEEDEEEDDEGRSDESGHSSVPSPFHLLLAAFVTVLHRYTGDTDIVVGSSSPITGEPLLLRIPIEPGDPFWQIVRRIQAVEKEAADDIASYEDIVDRLEAIKKEKEEKGSSSAPSAPIFRVRFFDELGSRQRNFVQSTSLTTDLTIFVAKPGAKIGASEGDGAADALGSSVTSEGTVKDATSSSTSRSALVPDISLYSSYNALIFSADRVKLLLAHISHVVIAASSNPTALVSSIGLRTKAEDAALPDPRTDLDFCGWQGSITSIFERNAKAHPDRRCIVESLPQEDVRAISMPPPASRVRQITYRQLDEASNVLAHHLLQSGLQREEVVTVYAYRGADLVVAVLGTLKAGGTFSVIDPAYPPSRQTIYLQVAKPRALVVLAKAGKLHPTVRKCIQDELEIRTEVPALELLDDASKVRGGSLQEGGADVLQGQQALASQSTNVILGPDSIGTLSFTSGSTGIPKGVRGRHHSLTHFFPWMGTRFDLDASSRFTMLSGIAHDPIQRDIFTPLFFGAELHVPTADDIGTPGRLAEWMAATQATVTHLTPAMGQLLSAQATALIPTLRNAFFVGDVLTKRDCTRLQALAANVRIINMYGTTETQRAVSYFEIPAISDRATFLATQKDIMPAGQGMKDVQLLVVNRHERTATCAVGEVGEIYVRSGGLAEGYLGPPEVTAEKFVANFLEKDGTKFSDTLVGRPEAQFWKGIRDRMYRTGDLGRYLPDGTVECTGRADDQVKIRGFRIELGEIDTHLSRHAHVRENVTLVRRDKDEEKVLVSYFVPSSSAAELEYSESSDGEAGPSANASTGSSNKDLVRGMRRYRNLIKDIRDHLKKKLPAYSVPTLFVPLGKMPLNPNGKIDKPALPFPDTAVASAALLSSSSSKRRGGAAGAAVNGGSTKGDANSASARGATPTEQAVAELFASLLPSCPRPVPFDESFFDLGGHSILATRLVFSMRKTFVVNVPLGIVFESPTVEGLAKEVERLRHADLNIGAEPVTNSTNAELAAKANAAPNGPQEHAQAVVGEDDYDRDVDALSRTLPESFISSGALSNIASNSSSSAQQQQQQKRTVLLTGATGFLGAFVLRDLLSLRQKEVGRVIAHVRAKDSASGLARLREGGTARSCWDEAWVKEGRLEVIVGDLAEERLGLKEREWVRLAQGVDVIVHNGALVHWVYPYSKLRAPNVLSTVACINLCATGKPKTFTLVSSTSALDTEHYVRLSDALVHQRGTDATQQGHQQPLLGVPETDTLQGSARGLKSGYGQSKYVAERLVMVCASRGLRASIIRPGYVVGDSESAVTNTDDFIWRLVKGSTQLGLIPDMWNSINMVPVDHVARITSLAALDTATQKPIRETGGARVYHVTGHPEIRLNHVLEALATYGWKISKGEYVQWRARLEDHVMAGGGGEETNALFPLLHFGEHFFFNKWSYCD